MADTDGIWGRGRIGQGTRPGEDALGPSNGRRAAPGSVRGLPPTRGRRRHGDGGVRRPDLDRCLGGAAGRRRRRVRLEDGRPGPGQGLAHPAQGPTGRGRVRRRRGPDPHPPGVATTRRAARLGGPRGRHPDRPRHPGRPSAARLMDRRGGLAGRGRRVHAERPPPHRQGEGPGRVHRVRAGGRRSRRVRVGLGPRGRCALADR